LAAGIHLLCVVLFGGSRNYPMVVPNQVATPGGWIMAYQKNTYLFSWPERLLPLVARYQARRSELFQSALESGSSIPSSEEFDTAYNLYSVRGKSIITEPICARSLAIALLACEETANWGFLHPGAFRHFPMSEFYASGKFLSHEIEAYHHRFLEELHPLSPARLEDPRMPVTTARMHEYLIQLLRL